MEVKVKDVVVTGLCTCVVSLLVYVIGGGTLDPFPILLCGGLACVVQILDTE